MKLKFKVDCIERPIYSSEGPEVSGEIILNHMSIDDSKGINPGQIYDVDLHSSQE